MFSQDSRGIVAGFWSRDIRRADGVAAAPLDLLANDDQDDAVDDKEDDHEEGDEEEEEEEKDGTGSGPGLPANGGEGSRVRGRSTDRRL